mgnify:CR=1 FL=1
MLIPNYNNLINKNNFEQFYNYMPSKSFRMLICGPSGSRKTNALVDMLLKPLIYYDKIYLYAKNIDQEKYQLLANELNKLSVKNKFSVDEIYEYSNSSIKDVDELENELQKIVIFDDYICGKNQDQIINTLSKEDIKIVVLFILVSHIIKLIRIYGLIVITLFYMT